MIAEIQDNLANAQQQLAELSAKMQNLVHALLQLDDALKYLLDAYRKELMNPRTILPTPTEQKIKQLKVK